MNEMNDININKTVIDIKKLNLVEGTLIEPLFFVTFSGIMFGINVVFTNSLLKFIFAIETITIINGKFEVVTVLWWIYQIVIITTLLLFLLEQYFKLKKFKKQEKFLSIIFEKELSKENFDNFIKLLYVIDDANVSLYYTEKNHQIDFLAKEDYSKELNDFKKLCCLLRDNSDSENKQQQILNGYFKIKEKEVIKIKKENVENLKEKIYEEFK